MGRSRSAAGRAQGRALPGMCTGPYGRCGFCSWARSALTRPWGNGAVSPSLRKPEG